MLKTISTKYILIVLIALLGGCDSMNPENYLDNSRFPVGANILEIYNSQRPFILWEFNGNCYLTTAQFNDLSGNFSVASAKCPLIIDPIKVIK